LLPQREKQPINKPVMFLINKAPDYLLMTGESAQRGAENRKPKATN